MEDQQKIGDYKINCLVSTLLERRLFIATNQDGKSVVLKESLINQNEQIIHEFDILNKLNCNNIIKPIELIDYNNKYYIVLPRAENELSQYMKSQTISDQNIRKIMHDLLLSIQYLHILGIWHRNVNPENILIFNENQEKRFVLTDFKFSINFTGLKNDEFKTTYQYMAPEMFEKTGCMF